MGTMGLLLFNSAIHAQQTAHEQIVYLRVNQVGYVPADTKIAIAFSHQSQHNLKFELVDAVTGNHIWGPVKASSDVGNYGNFEHHYRLDFSDFKRKGRYKIRLIKTGQTSLPFNIGDDVYSGKTDRVLDYLRQQQCGYNPFLDEVCHTKDGRTVYGPMPDGTFIDVTGGWHDASDYLQYMLTSGNTVGRLLFTYKENKGNNEFADEHNALGQPGSNGIPDILDEAKWGLVWLLKMHPKPDQLFHQIADDRDHIGFKMPYQDSSDYGWGPESYRVVYYATGKPQGLGKYQNTSTGIANLAGRYAAVMAMAYQVWKNDLKDTLAAEIFLKNGKEVYQMGLDQPGSQEGTPNLAPYRYHENQWADDMEWGAAELFKATRKPVYLQQSIKFAKKINTLSWMGKDTARHYEYYPFMNLGHYELYPLVDQAMQNTLADYYRTGLEAVWQRAKQNPYYIGYPFIWCSNNLASALITQEILYEKMSGDTKYREMALAVRDWLLGRNPWGVSQFIDLPHKGGNTPRDPHSAMTYLKDLVITGGLVDGPLFTGTFTKHHIELFKKDEYAPFQSDLVVYHDDTGDYSTNEPTLDGTAETLFWMSFFAQNPDWKINPR